ncbi:IclR family transcriptional regulator domain-containing protein [Halobellus sp. GM3]|uniref:IclR family transcriptional regulator domain-containing protein n=1 Tax=Halobellus sp. GM3 TaxID=3458410 RepID=UPI00403E1D7A
MDQSSNESRTIKSAHTLFAVIERIRESDGITVTQIARDLDVSPSTAHAHLKTLEKESWAVKRDSQYYLSLQFLEYGILARDQWDIVEYAKPHLQYIAEETKEAVWLVCEERGYGVFLDSAIGEHGVSVGGKIGSTVPLHWIAAGKAILSQYPEEHIREIIDDVGLHKKGPNSITTESELESELEEIRDQGVAFAEGELFGGLRAIGVPIMHNGNVLAGLSIGGPSNRLRGEYFRENLPELLLGEVNEIEIRYATE